MSLLILRRCRAPANPSTVRTAQPRTTPFSSLTRCSTLVTRYSHHRFSSVNRSCFAHFSTSGSSNAQRSDSAKSPTTIAASGSQDSIHALLAAHFDIQSMDFIATYGSAAFEQLTEQEAAQRTSAEVASSVQPQENATASSIPNNVTSNGVSALSSGSKSSASPAEENMLDLIFSVPDPMQFHSENVKRNPSHYSFLRHFFRFPSFIRAIQEYGAGVWYNTLVRLPLPASSSAASSEVQPATKLIKYGVISSDRLMRDLNRWESLYIAGRMHKPMHLLHTTPSLTSSAKQNLRGAIVTALLLLDSKPPVAPSPTKPVSLAAAAAAPAASPAVQPINLDTKPATLAKMTPKSPSSADSEALSTETLSFSMHQLFMTVCAISYAGDIRMGLAENPQKVAKIVTGSWKELVALYSPIIQEIVPQSAVISAAAAIVNNGTASLTTTATSNTSRGTDWSSPQQQFEIEVDFEWRVRMFAQLPEHVQHEILAGDAALLRQNLICRPTLFTPSSSSLRPLWERACKRDAKARNQLLTGALARIVNKSSKQQTLKGLATAGVRKSLQYAWAKIKKTVKK